MSDFQRNSVCNCQRCRLGAVTGPAILITIGTLFLISNYTRHAFLWPLILIVVGMLQLAKRTASTEGHVPMNSGQAYAQPPYPPYGQTPYPYAQPGAPTPTQPAPQPPTPPTAPATVTPPPVEYPSLTSGDKEKE